jgi:hypothetical protein
MMLQVSGQLISPYPATTTHWNNRRIIDDRPGAGKSAAK